MYIKYAYQIKSDKKKHTHRIVHIAYFLTLVN